jgi:hypothetical protein
VVAIIAAHNEDDILEIVIRDLHVQGVQVYVIDDASTDGTLEIAERLRGQGVIGIERLDPQSEGAGVFNWQRILERKAALVRELEGDWFIHHDADEFRESPWPRLRLVDAIGRVDALGYNAIDSIRLDFWPVRDDEIVGDVRDAFEHYAAPEPYDQRQIRIWKRTDAAVDLASMGGHEVRFDGRRVCPDRFILKHYPVRGQRHGERKIFGERLARFSTDERARGWHVQYDGLVPGQSLIRDPVSLVRYDADALRAALALTQAPAAGLEQDLRGAISELEEARRLHEIDCLSLQDARGEIQAARSALAQRQNEHDELSRQLADASRRVEEATQLLEATRLTRAADASAALAAIAALQQDNDSLRYQLADMRGSLSWRWTAPIRWALRRRRWTG